MMPNKTIYVSDADLPIYEEAQNLSGESLSSTVSRALHLFVESVSNTKKGFQTVELKVGSDSYKLNRFKGRLITSWRSMFGQVLPKEYRVYLTPKKNIALYVIEGAEMPTALLSSLHTQHLSNTVVYKLDVYKTLQEFSRHVPRELYQIVESDLIKETVEELDI